MMLVLIATVFPIQTFIYRWLNNYANLVMISYLLIGLFFFIKGRQALLFVAFLACGTLNLYLKYRTNPQVQNPPKDQSALKFDIGHFNASNFEDEKSYNDFLDLLSENQFEVLSFQEFTPYWEERLTEDLKERFPHVFLSPRVDLFGMAIFSVDPLFQAYTYEVDGIPIMVCRIAGKQRKTSIHLIGVYNVPVLNERSFEQLKQHLDQTAQFVSRFSGPMVVLGDFHVVSWSDELLQFKTALELKDSRRGYMPSFRKGTTHLWELPMDHIFYSKEFECTYFESIIDEDGDHLGIKGSYQLKKSDK